MIKLQESGSSYRDKMIQLVAIGGHLVATGTWFLRMRLKYSTCRLAEVLGTNNTTVCKSTVTDGYQSLSTNSQ